MAEEFLQDLSVSPDELPEPLKQTYTQAFNDALKEYEMQRGKIHNNATMEDMARSAAWKVIKSRYTYDIKTKEWKVKNN